VERLADWNKEYQDEPWYWGYGWWDWFEGSTKVVYHGLAGRVSTRSPRDETLDCD
jgi:hypothetical protein